jgi:hypothetical protein
MSDTPIKQLAPFCIEGPDENGFVWLNSPVESDEVFSLNLGPVETVAEAMSQWLGSLDCDDDACEESSLIAQ